MGSNVFKPLVEEYASRVLARASDKDIGLTKKQEEELKNTWYA